jgi:flavin-dependent dehydrogenase
MSQQQLTIDDAADRVWDVVVIGAGPSGALTALLLARRGLTTLLVERKSFPRDKVCGGCLNRRGIAVLKRCGVQSVLNGPATAALERIEVRGRSHGLTCGVSGSLAILRSEFDEHLASAAIVSGARFLPNTLAQVAADSAGGRHAVTLTDRHGRKLKASTKVVLACDGLSGNSLAQLDDFAPQVSPRARIGAGAVLAVDDTTVRPHCLHMAIALDGYVGRMRLGDRRICLGAALDPRAVRDFGLSGTICRILADCQVESASQYATSRLQGTVPLTRRPRCTSRNNVFLVGDACGYVEPFTGEGMALALETAEAVVPLVSQALAGWHSGLDRDWARAIRRIAFRRRAVCRCLSFICRRPGLVDMTLATASRLPRLLDSILAQINYLPHETRSVTSWHSI